MSLIDPKLTVKDLQKTAKKKRRAKGAYVKYDPLPGVSSDTLEKPDRKAHRENGKLAERISDALREIKTTDKNGQWFVLGWRLYPNRTHRRWKQDASSHACGCGCGCHAHSKKGHRKRK